MKAASFPLIAMLVLSLAACGGGKSADNTATNAAESAAPAASTAAEASPAAAGTIPNCGAVKAVWVNLKTKAYHEPGDGYYGKTKHGEYLCPAQAIAQGFHKAGSRERGKRHAENGNDSSQ